MTARARRVAAGLTVGLLGAGVASAHLSQGLEARLATMGHGSAGNVATFAAIQVAVAVSGVFPASLVAVAAGATFGVRTGFLLCASGTTIGGLIAFGLARTILRPWVVRWVGHRPAFARLDAAVAGGDWRIACLTRLSPVMPFAATSYGLGLTGMSVRGFLIGMVASLPALLGFVSVGAIGKAGLAGEVDAGTLVYGATLGIGAVASIALPFYLRKLTRADRALAVEA